MLFRIALFDRFESISYKQPFSQLDRYLYDSFTSILNERYDVGGIHLLCAMKPIEDATIKLLVTNPQGSPIGVLLCSSASSAQTVALATERSRLAKQAIGSKLGRVIIEPLSEGEIDGLSYAFMPYHQPLSNSQLTWVAQRTLLCPNLFKWLSDISKFTVTEVAANELETNFVLSTGQNLKR
jgi:hypothetical protein